MGENKSYEQLVEDYTRQIRETQGRILDDFFKAYAAQLASFGKEFSLDDICIIEQESHMREGCRTTRYWFEFKPKFDMSQ
jgi:hypothetical protein